MQRSGVEHWKIGAVILRHQQENFRAAEDYAFSAALLQPIDDFEVDVLRRVKELTANQFVEDDPVDLELLIFQLGR